MKIDQIDVQIDALAPYYVEPRVPRELPFEQLGSTFSNGLMIISSTKCVSWSTSLL